MKILLIVSAKDYQDKEYEDTRNELEKGGAEVKVASSSSGQANGKFGGSIEVDVVLEEVNVDDYDCLAFIGGSGATNYQHDEKAHRIAKEATEKGKILGAICITPTVLAYAGVVAEKNMTTWDDGNETEINILKEAGANYMAKDVVKDGKLVTANGPMAATEFGQTLLQTLQ